MIHVLTNRRAGPTPSRFDVNFIGSMRSYGRPTSAMTHSKRFKLGSSNKSTSRLLNYPEFPLPQLNESIALLSKLTSVKRVVHEDFDRNREMISGFESRAQAFPKYEDKTVFRSANINDRKHLI